MTKKIGLFTFLIAMTLWMSLQALISQPSQGAILAATIKAIPAQTTQASTGKFQPGYPVKLSVNIANQGKKASSAGIVYLRFVFPKPLDKEPNSLVFKTENVALPSIAAGEQIEISFSTIHQWPFLLDFIRDDWGMREYQAVIIVDNEEHIIGTRTIAVSAHYYEGPNHELPSIVQ
jgi:hypothetical protein